MMRKGPPQLLPEGLRDRLPPEAEAAQWMTRALLDAMRLHGYRRVAPPIAEFRETLSGEDGDGGGRDLLRFTDPVSRRTLAIRPDITRQVGRIATTRMAHAARPLRLSYAGQVVKLAATSLWPERELLQVGAELIGNDGIAAACEVVKVAVDSLTAAGVGGLTVDLTLPDLVDTLAATALPLAEDTMAAVRDALDAKDAGALRALGANAYQPLLDATGSFDHAISRLELIDSSGQLSSRIAGLRAIAATIGGQVRVTLDPTERHGFEYQSWIGFSILVDGHRATIGRGGSYAVIAPDGSREAAVGFSLYPDPLIGASGTGEGASARAIFLPLGHDPAMAEALRSDGWITIAALDAADDGRQLGCTHHLIDGAPMAY